MLKFDNLSYSKADPGLLVRVIPMLTYMMEDSHSSVVKRVMTAFMQLYMMAFTVRHYKPCVQNEMQKSVLYLYM